MCVWGCTCVDCLQGSETSEPLKLELQTWGPLQQQCVLLTTEPDLQLLPTMLRFSRVELLQLV